MASKRYPFLITHGIYGGAGPVPHLTGRKAYGIYGVQGSVVHRFHQAAVDPEPLIVHDRLWETGRYDRETGTEFRSSGLQYYGSVIRDGDRFRMWYTCGPEEPQARVFSRFTAYAESSDGLHWEKPELGLVEFDGSRANNLTDLPLFAASILDERDRERPEARYIAVGETTLDRAKKQWDLDLPLPRRAEGGRPVGSGGLWYMAQSGDGLHWELAPGESTFPGFDDDGRVIRDPYRDCYWAYTKAVMGLDFRRRRIIDVSQSRDLRAWNDTRIALAPDELDDQLAQHEGFVTADFYNFAMVPYEDFMVGFTSVLKHWDPPSEFAGRRAGPLAYYGMVEVQMCYSFDGYYWHRPRGRRPFIPPRERGCDWGCVYLGNTALEVGDEMWLYHSQFERSHGYGLSIGIKALEGLDPDQELGSRAIYLARIKRDRFASVMCNFEGSFVVPHGRVEGKQLRINASCPYGSVRVQVLTPAGEPVPGFGPEESTAFTGDSVEAEITWGGENLGALPPDKEYDFRFILWDAEVFGYEITDG